MEIKNSQIQHALLGINKGSKIMGGDETKKKDNERTLHYALEEEVFLYRTGFEHILHCIFF